MPIYELLRNVLEGLVLLAKHKNYRDYNWRLRHCGHAFQLQKYIEMLDGVDGPFVQLQNGTIWRLLGYKGEVCEGYTNMFLFVCQPTDDDSEVPKIESFDMERIGRIVVLQHLPDRQIPDIVLH